MDILSAKISFLWRRIVGRKPSADELQRLRREQYELAYLFQLNQRTQGRARKLRERKDFLAIAMIEANFRRRQALLDSYIDHEIIPKFRYREYVSRPHFKHQLKTWLESQGDLCS